MKNIFQVDPDNYSSRHKKKIAWYKILSVLCGIIVFCTTYAMILPAITLEEGGIEEVNPPLLGTEPEEQEDIVMEKQIKFDEDGEGYTLRIESFVTGETQIISERRPIDLVLALDCSGSMGDGSMVEYAPAYNPSSSSYTNYYYKNADGSYSRAYYCSDCKGWYTANHGSGCNHNVVGDQIIPKTSAEDESGVTFYTRSSVSNMRALQDSANEFITNIAGVSPESRVAIVKFADGPNDRDVITDVTKTGNNQYYTQTVAGLTSLSTANVASLKSQINNMRSGGDTASDWGLKLASDILSNARKAEGNDYDRQQIVVMFTDGEPNHGGDGLKTSVANDAIKNAKAMKDAGVIIYTVGCLTGADGTPYATNTTEWSKLSDVNKYMHFVSSNFSKAQSMSVFGTSTYPEGSSYYKSVADADSMIEAFEAISVEINKASVELNEESELKDYISKQYNLTETTTKKVSVHTETFGGVNPDGSYIWIDDNNGPRPEGLTVSIQNGLDYDDASGMVSVTGFDYSKYYVDVNAKPGSGHVGKKLVVEIPITPAAGVSETGMIKTNSPRSGMYMGEEMQGEGFPQPDVEVPATINVSLESVYAADIENNALSFTVTGAADAAAYKEAGKEFSDHIYLSDTTSTEFSLGKGTNSTSLYAIDHISKGETPVDVTFDIANVPNDYVLYATLDDGTKTQLEVKDGKASYKLQPTGTMNLVFTLEYKPSVTLKIVNITKGNTSNDITFDYNVSYLDYDNNPVSYDIKNFPINVDTDTLGDVPELKNIPLNATVKITQTVHDGYTVLYRNAEDTETLAIGEVYEFTANNDTTVIAQNTAGVKLPATGGIGTTIFTVCGIALMVIAVLGAAVFVMRGKKQN